MTATEAREYPIERVLARVATRPDVLAALRRGVGRPLDDAPSSWPYVMEAAGGVRSREDAAHVTLGLFALHQQSHAPGSMNQPDWGFGRACRFLRQRRSTKGSSEDGVERRFRAALSAESLTALAVHLRGLVTLLRGEDIPLDFARLFWDLSAWRNPQRRDKVALRWARDYFRVTAEDERQEAAS
jgi:CRISPR system Cascade subunit CasB